MTQPLRVVARIAAKPEAVEDLIPPLKTLVAETRAEAGCLQYDVLRGTEDPTIFVFIESWASEEEWLAHMNGDAIAKFRDARPKDCFVSAEVHPLADFA